MKNLILIILVSLLTFSCGEKEKVKEVSTPKEKVVEFSVPKIDYSNPAFMAGSDFLSFFKALRKIGNMDELISFTSSKTIDDFGVEKLKSFYKNSFTNMSKSKLKGMTSVNDSIKLLHYTNSEFATKKAFDIKVIIENDTTKIILDDLKPKYPFK